MKIVTVVGARPQFIKAAALSREIRKHASLEEIIVHTGQHFDANMSSVFFDEMGIPTPNYNLNIHGLSHGAMTGQMLEEIEKILIAEKPDLVLVYGDTNSTLAGALAAKKLNIKVAHVEAGLRSFNMNMPEEINRIITDRISDLLFCPTETAILNLEKEGFSHFNSRIIKTGDVMEDAALYYAEKNNAPSEVIHRFGLEDKPFILATLHRAENTDQKENLMRIVDALNLLHKTCPVVLPLHPRTANAFKQHHFKPDFYTPEPVGYLEMIQLLNHCSLVITDSGGLQKEAYFFNKYCVTLRNESEWVELITHHYNVLAGAETDKIVKETHALLLKKFPAKMNLYGNGHACANICEILLTV